MIYNIIIMEYQKIINLLDNTPNKPTKLSTKNWVEINNESRATYNFNSSNKKICVPFNSCISRKAIHK